MNQTSKRVSGLCVLHSKPIFYGMNRTHGVCMSIHRFCIHTEPTVRSLVVPSDFVFGYVCVRVCVRIQVFLCKFEPLICVTMRMRMCMCSVCAVCVYVNHFKYGLMVTLVKFNTKSRSVSLSPSNWKLRLIQNRFSFRWDFRFRSCHRLDLYVNELKKV